MDTKIDFINGNTKKSLGLMVLPLMAAMFLNMAYNLVDSLWIGNLLGETAYAALTNSTPIILILNAVAMGMGNGVAILLSQAIGANEKDKVLSLCGRVICLGYAIGFPLIAFALMFHNSVIGVYTENPGIVRDVWLPFVVMLFNYVFALPGYVYMNTVIGTGATRVAFVFQVTTISAYLLYLWWLSRCDVPLAVYWTVEYLFVIGLGVQSVIYLKCKRY